MKTILIFRASLLFAVLGSALGAQAVVIDVRSSGTVFQYYSFPSLEFISSNELGIDSQSTGGLPPFDGASMYYANDVTGPHGGASLFNDDDSNRLDLFLSVTSDSAVAGVRRISGGWTIDQSEVHGAYQGFSTTNSGGNWDFTWDTSGSAMTFDVHGVLVPVPEPAPLAALGFGAVAILRRLKRA